MVGNGGDQSLLPSLLSMKIADFVPHDSPQPRVDTSGLNVEFVDLADECEHHFAGNVFGRRMLSDE